MERAYTEYLGKECADFLIRFMNIRSRACASRASADEELYRYRHLVEELKERYAKQAIDENITV